MRSSLIILLVSLSFILIITSCEKEKVDVLLTNSNWEVEKYKLNVDGEYLSSSESYILKFGDDTGFSIFLDVNGCGGSYSVSANGDLVISQLYCTEVCCDSDYALNLIQLLPKMNSFYGLGDELVLEGEGKIILKRSIE